MIVLNLDKLVRPLMTARLALLFILFGGALFTACSSAAPAIPPTRLPAATNVPARLARAAAGPTKFARLAPTETATPTRTPRPTRTPTAEPTLTPTATDESEDTSTRRASRPATPVAAAAGLNSAAPLTAEPTRLPPATTVPTAPPTEPPSPTVELTSAEFGHQFVAALMNPGPCEPGGDSQYGVLGAGGWDGRPADSQPDLNLSLRGYRLVNGLRELVDYDGHTDDAAPQLWGLFADRRTPIISHTYQVFDWDWGANRRGDPIGDFDVTLAGLQVSPGENIFTPDFGREIGEGYVALVLYASPTRLTLKYTGEDNVVDGYTIHLEGMCVNPSLVRLYDERNGAGRGALPAVRPGQPLGYAPGVEIGVAVRDRGAFLDPRSRKDWWVGR